MDRERAERQFLDYLEGGLDSAAAAEFERILTADAELKRSFEQYQKLRQVERELALEAHSAPSALRVRVMDQLETLDIGFFRRLFMELTSRQMVLGASLATAVMLVLLVRQVGDEIPANFVPVSRQVGKDDLKTEEPGSKFKVIEGALTDEPVVKGSGGGVVVPPVTYGDKQNEVVDLRPTGPDPLRSIPAQEIDASRERLARESAAKRGAYSSDMSADHSARANTLPFPYGPGGVLLQSDALEPWSPPPPAQGRSYDPGMPRRLTTESHTSYIENRRMATSEESLSTFSIDVDTASYANSRRFLMRGALPPRDAVRIEEFLNYFDYNYPVQREKPFTLSYEIAPSPLESDRYLLKLGIKARDASTDEKPWNLVFLVDVSGSMMSPDKLELVKSSLKLLVNRMRSSDRIAIVTYAGNAGLVLDSSSIAEKARILSAIDSLTPGGSTHGSAGINLAYEVAARNRLQGGVNRVVLATDGDFNVGTTSHDELMRLIESKRAEGTTLTTIGVGSDNLKDSMMEQLADRGNGNYFYLDSFNEARKVLETDLVGNIEVVAKDVKLQIEFNPKHVAQYRLIGYENRKLNKEDFHNDQVDAGEIGSGHTVTALYELVLTGSPLAGRLSTEYRYPRAEGQPKPAVVDNEFTNELAFLKIRFKQPDGHASELLNFPISANDVQKTANGASADFRFAAAVSYFGHLLRKSEFAGSYSFHDVASLAEGALGEDRHGYRRDFVQLVKSAAALSQGSVSR